MTDYSFLSSVIFPAIAIIISIVALAHTINSNRENRREKRLERLADNMSELHAMLFRMKRWIPELNDMSFLSAFDIEMARLWSTVEVMNGTSLEIDMEKEAKMLMENVKAIAKIYHETDERLKQFQTPSNFGWQSKRTTKRQEEFSKNEALHKLILKAESEAEKWLRKNT